jgi:hypothetical protein
VKADADAIMVTRPASDSPHSVTELPESAPDDDPLKRGRDAPRR